LHDERLDVGNAEQTFARRVNRKAIHSTQLPTTLS
jgi:hypothetical protein